MNKCIPSASRPLRGAPFRPAILAVSVAILCSASFASNDWPQWRGANRDAKASGFTAPQAWPKELAEKWKVTVGDGAATPALVGDNLYVFSREGSDEVTRCLEAATGKEVWQAKSEAQAPNGPSAQFPGPRSSPAVAEGKIVTLGVRGTVCCREASTGKELWRRDEFNGETPQFFTASSPLIADGQCYVVLGGKDNGALVDYNLADGAQKWKWTGDGAAYSSPVVMTVGGTKLIVVITAQNIVAVKADDGKQVWEAPFAAQGMGAYNAATPIIDGQTLIYSGSKRGVKAVKLEKDGDNFTAKDLWSNNDQAVQFNTPVLENGLLFGLTQNNQLFCLKAQDGQTAWTAPVAGANAAPGGGAPPAGGPPQGGPAAGGPPSGAPPAGGPPPGGGGRMRGGGMRGGGFGSIVDAGSVLFALTPSSELVAFQPSDKAYTELARIKVADSPTHAYPVVAGNRVFIKDKDSVRLLAIE